MLLIIMWSFTAAVLLFLITMAATRLLRRPVRADVEAPQTGGKWQDPHSIEESQQSTKLPVSITESSIARDAWVLRLTEHVFDERHRSRYNVLVIKEDLEYFFSPDVVVEEVCAEYQETKDNGGSQGNRTIRYRITVFESGSLVNLGDGGDINWDWKGNFNRTSGKTLTFSPCVRGTRYQQDPSQPLAAI
jgi:hypothetical protein